MFYIGVWILAALFHHLWLQTISALGVNSFNASPAMYLNARFETAKAAWTFSTAVTLAVFLMCVA